MTTVNKTDFEKIKANLKKDIARYFRLAKAHPSTNPEDNISRIVDKHLQK